MSRRRRLGQLIRAFVSVRVSPSPPGTVLGLAPLARPPLIRQRSHRGGPVVRSPQTPSRDLRLHAACSRALDSSHPAISAWPEPLLFPSSGQHVTLADAFGTTVRSLRDRLTDLCRSSSRRATPTVDRSSRRATTPDARRRRLRAASGRRRPPLVVDISDPIRFSIFGAIT